MSEPQTLTPGELIEAICEATPADRVYFYHMVKSANANKVLAQIAKMVRHHRERVRADD